MNTIKKMWEDVKLYSIGVFVFVAGLYFFYFVVLCAGSFVNQAFGGQPLDVFELMTLSQFFHR